MARVVLVVLHDYTCFLCEIVHLTGTLEQAEGPGDRQ